MVWSLIAFYAYIAMWALTLAWSAKTGRWMPFVVLGVVGLVVVNSRYFIFGIDSAATFFVSLADPFINLGSDGPTAVAVPCSDGTNNCTAWGDTYVNHAAWTLVLYDRYVDGPQWRQTLLYGHILFNSIALCLATLQVLRPAPHAKNHKSLGYITLTSTVISLACASWITMEISELKNYGAMWGELGLYFLAICVLAPLFAGIYAARSGNMAQHRVWMWRYVGAIWGSFWIFRLEGIIVDIFVREVEGLSIVIPSWTAGLIGIAVGDTIRKRLDKRESSSNPAMHTAGA